MTFDIFCQRPASKDMKETTFWDYFTTYEKKGGKAWSFPNARRYPINRLLFSVIIALIFSVPFENPNAQGNISELKPERFLFVFLSMLGMWYVRYLYLKRCLK